MAPIALFLCLVFIAGLLARDIKRRKSVNGWAIWIPTILLLIVGSRPVSVWIGAGTPSSSPTGLSNDAERSPIEQVFYLSVLLGGLLVGYSRRVQWKRFFGANTALMVFYCYFAISLLWSDDPFGSTKRLVKDFGMLFVVAIILSEKDPLQAIRAVYVRCACVLFPLSVVLIRYFPSYARDYSRGGEPMYTGVTMQKNSLGEIVLVFSLFLLWDWLEVRRANAARGWGAIPWERIVLLLMGVWLLNMSQSKTALVCLLIGAALTMRSGWLASRRVSRIVLFAALCTPFLLFFYQQFSSFIAPVVEALGRDMTFTGRTDIWEHITATTVNPIIGAGYWNFWGGRGGMAIIQAMHTPVPNAHCGYLDIYLDGGVIGLFVLLCFLVACGRRLVKKVHVDRFQKIRFAILIVLIIYDLSESMFARLSPLWVTSLLMLVDFPALRARARNPRVILKSNERSDRSLAIVQDPVASMSVPTFRGEPI